LLLLTACSDKPAPFSERDRIAVRFSLSGIQSEVSTRADGNGTSPLAEGTTLRILAFERVGTDANLSQDKYIGEGTYIVNSSGSLTAVTSLLLLEGTYDFYALTPSSVAVNKISKSCTVLVNHGIDYASSTEATTATIKENSSSVELKVLTRHCSRLVFNFLPKYDNVTSVKISSAELTNMTNAPVVGALNTSLPIESADKTASVTLSNEDFTPIIGKPLEYSASTIVLPRKAGGFDFKMAACFNGNTTETVYSAPLPADLPFLPGYQYTFTVKMKGDAAELELGVAPWGDEYSFDTDMGEYYTIELTVDGWQDITWDDTNGGSLGDKDTTN
ncbi:MAG: fimbrillin family protein, partial [Bacteroides sp.]|nr:fimbrillin family protein [Bacteroides sp.]